ncbi:MAG TPA: carbonic anhydrase [Gemmataceae bacterium]|nr:carbonic anhydrase [Gemmataceae bacterium]
MKPRGWVLISVAAGLVGAFVLPLHADEPVRGKLTQEARPTPDEALKRLKEGNARFVTDGRIVEEPASKKRLQLSQGQQPIAVVLTCADSRVAPEIIFDQGLGVLFVLRLAGNVGEPAVYASIEYALAELKSPLIIVVGHTSCGAVSAALKGKEQPSDNLRQLVGLIHTGGDLPKDPNAALDAAVRNNVQYQTQLLTKRSKIIQDFAGSGRIKIVPAVYDLKTGSVRWLDLPMK